MIFSFGFSYRLGSNISPRRKSRSCGAQFLRKFRLFAQTRDFRKFCLGVQFLRKFATLRSAIFHKVRKFCNLCAICAQFVRRYLCFHVVFTLKFALSVMGWCAINSANWAKIGLKLGYSVRILWRLTCKIHLTQNTTD